MSQIPAGDMKVFLETLQSIAISLGRIADEMAPRRVIEAPKTNSAAVLRERQAFKLGQMMGLAMSPSERGRVKAEWGSWAGVLEAGVLTPQWTNWGAGTIKARIIDALEERTKARLIVPREDPQSDIEEEPAARATEPEPAPPAMFPDIPTKPDGSKRGKRRS